MRRMTGFTKRRVIGSLCFILIFCALFAAAERFLWDDRAYSSVWTRVGAGGGVPEVLIVGNSHAFCSFVPDILNGALGVDSAVLASSGANAAAVADSVEAALDAGAPRLLVVELNPFYAGQELMARNHKYFALSNINGMPSAYRRALSAYGELGLDSVPQGVFQLLRADMMWSRWSTPRAATPVNRYEGHDVLGYQQLDWFAAGGYRSAEAVVTVSADASEVELLEASAEGALRRIMSLAGKRGVEVWLVKTPIAMREYPHPTVMDAARLVAADYAGTATRFIDYNDRLAELSLTSGDFYDGGHLNRRGAAKLTLRFARELGDWLGAEPCFDDAFAYIDEAITPVSDGLWRYEVKALGRDVMARFTLEADGEAGVIQDWSDKPYVELELPPERADSLLVSLCPLSLLSGADEYAHTLRFMTADSCVIN